jgi:hypothetical protein
MIPALRDALIALGIARLYALDFEFQQADGDLPKPICACYRCILTGESGKLWLWGDTAPECPFPATEEIAFAGYNFAAEASCFAVLGWPRPTQVLDLYLEYLQVRNTWPSMIHVGDKKKERKRLLDALRYFGLETRDVAAKEYWQERAQRGGPWEPGEPEGMMKYCLEDSDDVGRLLDALAQKARLEVIDNLAYAFVRGRYSVAVASMVRTGVPVDGRLLGLARKHRARIQNKLIERLDPTGVYDRAGSYAGKGGHQKIHYSRDRITSLIEASGLGEIWPRTDNGKMYAIDKKTLARMSALASGGDSDHPHPLKSLAKLRGFLGKIHPFDFDVGPDGRARASLFPFGTKTGRNNPSKSIFGVDRGLRGLIKPGEGQAVGLLDWERNEPAVAGYKSGDEALLRLAKLADPYIHLGITYGLIPEGGTKDSHPDERQRCKSVILGAVLYGMGAESISERLEISLARGQDIWARIHRDYRVYWQWAERQADWAASRQPLRTPFGHTLGFESDGAVDFSVGTARNFHVQATAAEIMRLAAILATEAGIAVCAPVHDAFLIEAPIESIEREVERMKGFMAQAVELVLWPGCTISVDGDKIVKYPNSMRQKSEIFDIIIEEIEAAERESLLRESARFNTGISHGTPG